MMSGTQQPAVTDALQHLDALLSAEAAQLTNDELLLVSDMVEQLMGTSGPPQQHSTNAGVDLASQVQQMLSCRNHAAQEPKQQERQQAQQGQQNQHQMLWLQHQQQMQPPAVLTAQRMPGTQAQHCMAPSAQQPTAVVAVHPGRGVSLSQPSLVLQKPTDVGDTTGLASPSSSSVSACSRPTSPSTGHLTSRPATPQRPAAGPQPTAGPALDDTMTQAAADMLAAALADPEASIEEIVGMFDKVLTAGEEGGRELQGWLAAKQPMQLQQQQPAAVLQQQQQQLQLQQQGSLPQSTPHLQTPMQLHGHPQTQQTLHTPVAMAAVAASRLNAEAVRLLEPNSSHEQPALGAHPSLSPAAAAAANAAVTAECLHASKPSMLSCNPWLSGRPSTAPHAAQQFPACGHSLSMPQQPDRNGQSWPHGNVALMAAAGAKRSQSPDVFKRLSAVANQPRCADSASRQQTSSPTAIERSWLDSLRGNDGGSHQGRDRSTSSSCSRSRSCSRSPPAARHQGQGVQQSAVHLDPWLSAAIGPSRNAALGMTRSCPVEWDAQTRSPKTINHGEEQRASRGKDCSPVSEADAGASVQKLPLRLPPHVIEERMRRFYERNLDWKRRCALVYERQRQELEQGQTEGCTFAPAICKKSDKLARELRTSYPMRSIRPMTPLADTLGAQEQQLRKQQLPQQQQRSASAGRVEHQQASACLSVSQGSSCRNKPGAAAAHEPNMPPAVRRLFEDAAVRSKRAQQYKDVTAKAERKARSWSAPRCAAAEGVQPRVYDHLDANRSRRRLQQKYTDECAFKPWTNPRPQPRTNSVQRSADQASKAVDHLEHEEVVEEFVALLDTVQESHRQAAGGPRQEPGRPGTAPAATSTGQHKQGQQSRSSSAKRIGSASNNMDLDWAEFIDRQSRFVTRKEAKVAAVAAYEYKKAASPELSPGTKRILAEKQMLWASAGELGGSGRHTSGAVRACSPPTGREQGKGTFLGRLEQQSQSHPGTLCSNNQGHGAGRANRSLSSRGYGCESSLNEECTFKPNITPKAAAMKARSAEEMSEGDRLRREVKLEQLRVLREARQLAGATFRPDLSPSRQRDGEYESVPPRITMSSDGLSAYMASLQEKRKQLDERRRAAERRKQEQELRECTFKPETTPVPAYITEMAEVGYTARYIDRVMQGALSDSPPSAAAAATTPAQKLLTGSGGKGMEAGSQACKPQRISTKY